LSLRAHAAFLLPIKKHISAYYKKQGWERVNKKVRYFYDNRLRFPSDVMLYWGLFKACGYRYNEENMIKLFVLFPWAAYCDELMDGRDIIPMLNDLAGFFPGNQIKRISVGPVLARGPLIFQRSALHGLES